MFPLPTLKRHVMSELTHESSFPRSDHYKRNEHRRLDNMYELHSTPDRL
jgi:hypothetical protein